MARGRRVAAATCFCTAAHCASRSACRAWASRSRPATRPTVATLRRTSSQVWSACTSSTRTPALRTWSSTTGGPASVVPTTASGLRDSSPSAESWRM